MRFFLIISILFLITESHVLAQDSNSGNIEISGSIGPAFSSGSTTFYGNAELNYYLAGNMSLTAGYEFLNNDHSLILGNRIYIMPDLHFSMKGVLVSQTDFALGGGYSRGIGNNLVAQVNGDWYFARKTFALSFGIGIRI